MKENYTITSFLLVFIWSFFLGSGASESAAQSGCGIRVDTMNVQSEKIIEGVLHKKVQVLVNVDKPGLAKRFYFLFDSNDRDSTTKSYPYGLNSDEFWVPVDVNKITFYDFNNPNGCNVEYYPNFTVNVCDFDVTPDLGLSEDCYHRTAAFILDPGIKIDSVVWFRDGGSVPVYDQMEWVNIPPGSYEIFFYDDKGCEATSFVETCLTRTNAGGDHSFPYCIGEDDTVNLYDILDADVDSGSFFSEAFDPLDSVNVTRLAFDKEGQLEYYYIAPAIDAIPDTSLITINVRNCSVCAYDLISVQRHCSDPEMMEVTIGGGSPGDTAFLVTLPDGSEVTQKFYTPFQFHYPDFQDSVQLYVHMDTPTGVCDSILMMSPVSNPLVLINATEIDLPGDSVGIRISVSQGTEPYQVDVFVGAQQKFVNLGEGSSQQIDFLQSNDTAYIMAMDDEGCMGMDTLLLTPDCVRPVATFAPVSCGEDNGQISVDSGSLPPDSEIVWDDTTGTDLWHRSDLSPGTYYYSVVYETCRMEDSIVLDASLPVDVEVLTSNECFLDGKVEIYIPDSLQVRQWSYNGQVLPYFYGTFSVNEDHVFHIKTIDGCIDSAVIRAEEPFWLNQIGYQKPKRLISTLGVDLTQLNGFGWRMGDSILCDPCGDYESENILLSGAYTFFAEQGPDCRRDTTITINQSEHLFLMPNAIAPGSNRNNLIQIFDPLNQMASIMEFQVYDRFGNILYEKYDFYPDDDSSINWPNGMATELPDVIVCIAKIKCKEGDEVTMAQDVLILR